MSDHLPDVDMIPEVKLTLKQVDRAHAIWSTGGNTGEKAWRAARLIVHQQDRIAELERIIARDDTTTSYKCNECGAWHLQRVTTETTEGHQ